MSSSEEQCLRDGQAQRAGQQDEPDIPVNDGATRTGVTSGATGMSAKPTCRRVAATVAVGLAVMAGCTPAPADPDRPDAGVDEMATSWLLTPHDLDPTLDDGDFEASFTSLDGSLSTEFILDAGDTWVVATEATKGSESSEASVPRPFQLFGIDPADGSTQWQTEVAGGYCGHAVITQTLTCLHLEEEVWSLLVIDASTGDERSRTVTDLDSVHAVHRVTEGLLVVGEADPAPHAALTLLTNDGATSWSLDLADLDDADLLFQALPGQDAVMERVRWRDLDDGMVLLWSTDGAALIDPAEGAVLTQPCQRATTIGTAYFCDGEEGVARHDLTGEVRWTAADVMLANPPEDSPGRPLALVEDGQAEHYRLHAMDWETGEIGEHLTDLEPRQDTLGYLPVAVGTAEHLFLTNDEELIALEPDSDTIAWQIDLGERAVWDGAVLDGIAVFRDSPGWAVDAATGAERWEGRIPGIYLTVLADRLVATGPSELALVELP